MSEFDKAWDDRISGVIEKTNAAAARLGTLIREKREEAGLSQADLATLAKSSQQTIDRIERGETKHSRAFPRLLAALKIESDTTFSELAINEARLEEEVAAATSQRFPEFVPSPGMGGLDQDEPGHLKVYSLDPYDGRRYLFVPSAVDYVSRPEPLRRVRRGYAMLVPDDTNYPTLRAGDTLLVNPHIPVRADNEAVLSQIVKEEKATYSLIATIVAVDAETYTVRHGSGEPYSLRKADWDFANVVVGKFNRL
ncbi:MAG: helix-turn-helix family protein [Tardiphaga sp.]|nr:helix-turn-helix family protein [Tardiphaga sp.]